MRSLPKIFVLTFAFMLTAALMWFGGNSQFWQGSLLDAPQQKVTLWENTFKEGLPKGWEQTICETETSPLPSAFVCIKGEVLLPYDVQNGQFPKIILEGTNTGAAGFDLQVITHEGVHNQSITEQKFSYTLLLEPASQLKAIFLIRLPADNQVTLRRLAVEALKIQDVKVQEEKVEKEEKKEGDTKDEIIQDEEESKDSTEKPIVTTPSSNSDTVMTGSTMSDTTVPEEKPETIQVGQYTLQTQPVASSGGGGGGGGSVQSTSARAINPESIGISVKDIEKTAEKVIQAKSTAEAAPISTRPSAQASSDRTFQDVESEYFAKDAISQLAARGIIDGYKDGTFKPNNSLNRAELAKLLVEAFPTLKNMSKTDRSLFDVNATHWFAPYVYTLMSSGVVKGYPDGTFRAGNPVTRAEAIKMLLLSSGYKEKEILGSYTVWQAKNNDLASTFKDVASNAWYAPYLYMANKDGIVTGKESSTGRLAAPLDALTRGEAALILYRLLP